MTGMALNSGVGVAAQAIASKLAAAMAESDPATPVSVSPKVEDEPEIDPFINCGPAEGNRIAITFDDGPVPGVTERILDALKQRNLVATFFMIGQNVEKFPELVRRVVAEGHEIGNHTYTHPKLNSLPDQQADLELQQTQDIIMEAVKIPPTCFRPPYLAFRKNQSGIPHRKGLTIICGDVDSRDWSLPGEDKIVDTILSQTKAGSIIICHDWCEQTANCIDRILDGLVERSFKFSTIASFIKPCQIET
jgi:peptidoglycan/xylan/chitin deacetylase (PgdA/CDA1 family)